MRHRLQFIVVFTVVLALPRVSTGDAGQSVQAKVAEAMESYDVMEFESAKNLLVRALEIAEENDYRGGEVAQAYLSLGIVLYSGLDDPTAARAAFAEAVALDEGIEVDVAYRTREISAILDDLRGGSALDDVDEGATCADLEGLEHELLEEAVQGRSQKISARAGEDLDASGVSLYYRMPGDLDFAEVKLSKKGECTFSGELPAKATSGELLHYYVAALDETGKPLESKGSSGSPNIIQIVDLSDDEDPLGAGGHGDVSIGDSASTSGDDSSFFLSIAVGSGMGYINGPTEATKNDVQCCLAPAYLHLMPEIGFFVSKQFAISGAFRMGFPVTANVMYHATFAPAGVARFRYILDEEGDGVELSAALGGGIIRNTVPIENPVDPNMNVDTTAMGPLLVGGGLGYNTSLGGPMRFVAEINALAGIPAFGSGEGCEGSGCVQPKFGVQVDANLAVLFAF